MPFIASGKLGDVASPPMRSEDEAKTWKKVELRGMGVDGWNPARTGMTTSPTATQEGGRRWNYVEWG
jgi:hypothetical protein